LSSETIQTMLGRSAAEAIRPVRAIRRVRNRGDFMGKDPPSFCGAELWRDKGGRAVDAKE
jgi:hypothetical protein